MYRIHKTEENGATTISVSKGKIKRKKKLKRKRNPALRHHRKYSHTRTKHHPHHRTSPQTLIALPTCCTEQDVQSL